MAAHGSLVAPFPTTLNTKQTTMATPTREALVSLLGDRIEILDRNATGPPLAGQVFRTVRAILAFVRVRALLLRFPVDPSISPVTRPGQNDYGRLFCRTLRLLLLRVRNTEHYDPRDEGGWSRRIGVAGT